MNFATFEINYIAFIEIADNKIHQPIQIPDSPLVIGKTIMNESSNIDVINNMSLHNIDIPLSIQINTPQLLKDHPVYQSLLEEHM